MNPRRLRFIHDTPSQFSIDRVVILFHGSQTQATKPKLFRLTNIPPLNQVSPHKKSLLSLSIFSQILIGSFIGIVAVREFMRVFLAAKEREFAFHPASFF